MTNLARSMYNNTKIAIGFCDIDIERFNKLFGQIETDVQQSIYFISSLRKLGLAYLALKESQKLTRLFDTEDYETRFYSVIFLLAAALDSLACFLNEFYQLDIQAQNTYFYSLNTKSLSSDIQLAISQTKEQLGLLGFFDYRNTILHREIFPPIPSSPNDSTREDSVVESYLVCLDPKINVLKLQDLKKQTTDAKALLSRFADAVKSGIVSTLGLVQQQAK